MAEYECELGIENFSLERDDFESWVELFEQAIKLRLVTQNSKSGAPHGLN